MNNRLLVCDLDNTLYDWVGYFVPSFYAMVDEVVRITGCDRDALLDDFREVHQHHHDSEHPFALLETRTIKSLFPRKSRSEVAEALDPAFHAFNSTRKTTLKLYPGVREGLEGLRNAGLTLVAHTESKLYAVKDRLTRLDLIPYFSRVYCRERPKSLHPNPKTGREWLNTFPMNVVVELSHHQRKPDPKVLLEICHKEGFPLAQCAYVGDSIARDILMAKKTGCLAIWAKYGSSHDANEYKKLVRITHWTPADVSREAKLQEEAKTIRPDIVLQQSFAEILAALDLPKHLTRKRAAIG